MTLNQVPGQLAGELTTQLQGLGLNITIWSFAWAALAMVVAFVVNKISDRFIERAIKRRNGDQHAAATAKKVSAYFIYAIGFIFVLGAFGIPIASLGTAVGLIGLGLSFALKDMIANFVSGIMILVNRPFKIGDQIAVSGEEGTVKDIQIRATAIKTYDGRKVIVPNSTLYNGMVINNTAYNERRFDVVVGIDYEEDIKRARELAMETLEEVDSVESDPEPQVLVNELADSSVNLKLRGWTKPSRANMVKSASEVTELVKNKYDDAGIDIPYPIRTVFMNEE